MTNMSNIYTLSTSIINLITALIRLIDMELVELTSDMICGTCVYVPVCMNSLGTFGLFWWLVIIIIIITITSPTLISWMALLLANLIEDTILPRWEGRSFLPPFLGRS
jgi:hypothetical protein